MLNAQPILIRSGAMGQIDGQQRDVGDALVALVLEVMLGEPERVVSERVGGLRQRRRGLERLDQARVGVAAVVGRNTGEAALFQLDVADVERREPSDHGRQPRADGVGGVGAAGGRDHRPPAR